MMNRQGLKRTAFLCIVLLLLPSVLTGCKCEHQYTFSVTKAATCASEGERTYTCTLCGDTYTETIAKTTTHAYSSEVTKEATVTETGIKTYTCSVCGDTYTEKIDKIFSHWEIGYYVDDFGDETSDAYVMGKFFGTFSNSATRSSDLTVLIYLNNDSPNTTQIRLLEYGYHKATFSSLDTIILKTKNSDGHTRTFYMKYIYGDLYSTDRGLADEILNSSQLSIVITTSSEYQTIPDTYNFKINNNGLNELLDMT